MSSSRHPIALKLEQQVGGATKLLATVMLLPLIDGIFPSLVLANALDSTAGIIQVGLIVFGGSATLAVILVEMEEDLWSQTLSVLIVGIPLILLAAIEAALAPTIASFLDIVVFERFAAIVIVAIAAKTASATVGNYLPRPSVIIALGAIASIQPGAFSVTFSTNPELILRAAASGGVGVGFALGVVALRPQIQDIVDVDRFRFGSAIALGTLALSIINVVPSQAPLPVFAMAGILSFDPNAENDITSQHREDAATTDGGQEPNPTAQMDDRDNSQQLNNYKYGYSSNTPPDEKEPWM